MVVGTRPWRCDVVSDHQRKNMVVGVRPWRSVVTSNQRRRVGVGAAGGRRRAKQRQDPPAAGVVEDAGAERQDVEQVRARAVHRRHRDDVTAGRAGGRRAPVAARRHAGTDGSIWRRCCSSDTVLTVCVDPIPQFRTRRGSAVI